MEDILKMPNGAKFTSSIILAYGSGKRFSSELNKLFLPLNGLPIIEHSLKKFNNSPLINEIILVAEDLVEVKKKYEKIRHIVKGGKTREESALYGFKNVSKEADFVLIHDAARPLFPVALIEDEIKELSKGDIDGIVPLLPIYDAIKLVNEEFLIFDEKIYSRLMRDLRLTQTPQGFRVEVLKEAFSKNIGKLANFRDEAELVLSCNRKAKIKALSGNFNAHKLTCSDDLKILNALGFREIRTGLGYDFHPFVEGKPLIIGGIEIPYSFGLSGDSDADVLTHSIIDAILGASGKGDIGSFFGVGTEDVLGIKSISLLSKLFEDSFHSSFEIVNVDSTVVCRNPDLSEYKTEIEKNLAKIMKTKKEKINIKATTDKGFDAAGTGQGIRAITIVTLKLS